MLVSDMMCNSGLVKGITRYGVVSEKSSVLARASFETPIKHLINASLVGETDLLSSVVENVMLNQTIPAGTGMREYDNMIVTSQKEMDALVASKEEFNKIEEETESNF